MIRHQQVHPGRSGVHGTCAYPQPLRMFFDRAQRSGGTCCFPFGLWFFSGSPAGLKAPEVRGLMADCPQKGHHLALVASN
jgi:hypothetical protein